MLVVLLAAIEIKAPGLGDFLRFTISSSTPLSSFGLVVAVVSNGSRSFGDGILKTKLSLLVPKMFDKDGDNDSNLVQLLEVGVDANVGLNDGKSVISLESPMVVGLGIDLAFTISHVTGTGGMLPF